MNDRSQIPMRYPICSAVTAAIAINAIDQTLTRARNAGRDRADKREAHHGNKNENLEPLTERDPSNKADDYK